MTMRVTILSTVMGESGSLLTAGSTYTVSDQFGQELVNSGRATDTDRAMAVPQTELKPYFATAPLTGAVTGLVGPGGVMGAKFDATRKSPWKLAFWGDSRFNALTTAAAVDFQTATSLGVVPFRTPAWMAGYMGDAECYQSFAVSGDAAVNWASTSRANGKTFAALAASDADVVVIQYGVNDAQSLTATATISNALKALISEILKFGKLVIFEAINPVSAPAVSNAAAVQPIVDATNAEMKNWLAAFAGKAIYVDTATAQKTASGYLDLQYSDTSAGGGLHHNRKGAQLAGRLLAAGARTLLPKRSALFYGPESTAPNLCNVNGATPVTTQFNTAGHGSASVVQSFGVDSGGYYYEWVVTPTAFNVNYTEVALQLSANFQTASPPFGALLGNELLQGGGRVVIDDGTGGAPNIYAFTLRQRFYLGSTFAEVGQTSAPGNVYDSAYTEKIDVQMLTPRIANATPSSVATPGFGAGYALQLLVDSSVLNVPYRVRIYNPSLRRVGYTSTPVAVTPPASTAAYTNSTAAPQQIFFAGGTVSAITVNAVSTGLTSGVFVLNPGDTLTPTYTVAPTTFTVQQLLTQPTLRGLM